MSDEGERLRDILQSADTITVVGASIHPEKEAHAVPARLQMAGFRIIPVNPRRGLILGEQAYATLAEVPDPVDVVEVFRPSADAADVAREAAAVGAKVLWLQEGIVSPDARAIAEAAGMTYVEDRCMAVIRGVYQIVKPGGR